MENSNRDFLDTLNSKIDKSKNLIDKVILLISALALLSKTIIDNSIVLWIGLSIGLIYLIFRILLKYIPKSRLNILTQIDISNKELKKSLIRGLLPFETGDLILGRDNEITLLYTMIVSKDFKFGFITGESGVGKTSILRAGIIPKLQNANYKVEYISKLRLENIYAIFPFNQLKETSEKRKANEKSIVLILDQFEDLFISYNETDKKSFIDLIGDLIKSSKFQIKILLSLRKEFIGDLLDFSSVIDSPVNIKSSFKLKPWSFETTKHVLLEIIKREQLNLSEKFVHELSLDLCSNGTVKPVEFQIILGQIKENNILSLSQLNNFQGTSGLLKDYLKSAILPLKENQVELSIIKLILIKLCNFQTNTKKIGGVKQYELINEIKTKLPDIKNIESRFSSIIQKLINNYVIHFETNKHINLTHDYLVAPIKELLFNIHTNEEKANELVKNYITINKFGKNITLNKKQLNFILQNVSNSFRKKKEYKVLVRNSRLNLYYNYFFKFIIVFIISVAVFPIEKQIDMEKYQVSKGNWVLYNDSIIMLTKEASKKRELYNIKYDIYPIKIDTTIFTNIKSNAISRDGKYVAIRENNNKLYICKRINQKIKIDFIINLSINFTGGSFSPDSRFIYNGNISTIDFFDLTKKYPNNIFKHKSLVNSDLEFFTKYSDFWQIKFNKKSIEYQIFDLGDSVTVKKGFIDNFIPISKEAYYSQTRRYLTIKGCNPITNNIIFYIIDTENKTISEPFEYKFNLNSEVAKKQTFDNHSFYEELGNNLEVKYIKQDSILIFKTISDIKYSMKKNYQDKIEPALKIESQVFLSDIKGLKTNTSFKFPFSFSYNMDYFSFSEQNNILIIKQGFGNIKFFDIGNISLPILIKEFNDDFEIKLSPNGENLVMYKDFYLRETPVLHIIKLSKLVSTKSLTSYSQIQFTKAEFSPDSKYILLIGLYGYAYLYDIRSKKKITVKDRVAYVGGSKMFHNNSSISWISNNDFLIYNDNNLYKGNIKENNIRKINTIISTRINNILLNKDNTELYLLTENEYYKLSEKLYLWGLIPIKKYKWTE